MDLTPTYQFITGIVCNVILTLKNGAVVKNQLKNNSASGAKTAGILARGEEQAAARLVLLEQAAAQLVARSRRQLN